MTPGVGTAFIASVFKIDPRWANPERGRDECGPYHHANMWHVSLKGLQYKRDGTRIVVTDRLTIRKEYFECPVHDIATLIPTRFLPGEIA
jgi:hypothetical protein